MLYRAGKGGSEAGCTLKGLGRAGVTVEMWPSATAWTQTARGDGDGASTVGYAVGGIIRPTITLDHYRSLIPRHLLVGAAGLNVPKANVGWLIV